MDKKYMKAGFLAFLVACAGAYAAYTARDDDPRATEFANYVSTEVDKMVANQLTDEEIQLYIKSYREDPVMFDAWIDQLAEDSKKYNHALIKDAAAIHKLDSVAGRKLSFGEALHRIEQLQDTAANPLSEVALQRVINMKKELDTNLALSHAAKERIGADK